MDGSKQSGNTKKQKFKSVYLDADTLQALEFLKKHRHKGGLRFSVSALMHEMLDFLTKHPERTLSAERHAARSSERGKAVSMALPEADIAMIDGLTDYYQQHAKPTRRVRDGVPKLRKLPLSPLFSNFLRDSAADLGWSPEGSNSAD